MVCRSNTREDGSLSNRFSQKEKGDDIPSTTEQSSPFPAGQRPTLTETDYSYVYEGVTA